MKKNEKQCYFCLFFDLCKGGNLENICNAFLDKWEYDKQKKLEIKKI